MFNRLDTKYVQPWQCQFYSETQQVVFKPQNYLISFKVSGSFEGRTSILINRLHGLSLSDKTGSQNFHMFNMVVIKCIMLILLHLSHAHFIKLLRCPAINEHLNEHNKLKLKTTFSKFDFRFPLAGGLAGALSTAVLFPIDTFKTMMQTDPSITSIQSALKRIQERGFITIYSGFVPSVFGALTSSSIYFGSYEYCKSCLHKRYSHIFSRQAIHSLSAISGNLLSSIVFVPKDTLKQHMQYLKTSQVRPSLNGAIPKTTLLNAVADIYSKKGIRGFYKGYLATLLRNIPSAVIRFTIYEELKHAVQYNYQNSNTTKSMLFPMYFHNVCFLFCGGLASSLSAAVTTPLDVIKSRLAVGLIPPGTPIASAIQLIVDKDGYKALYKGIKARMLWSALFGGIGFYTFEICKSYLGLPVLVPLLVREPANQTHFQKL